MAATKSDRAATLVAMLERNALAHPDRLAYRFLSYTSPTGFAAHQEDLDFREVYERVERVAAHLGEVAEPGDRALLLLKSDPDFLIGFLACLRAGVIAVPVAHPERRHFERELDKLRHVVVDATPSVVITTAAHRDQASAMATGALGHPVRAFALADLEGVGGSRGPLPSPSDAAFLQYTSGSTTRPKGVVITHANLVSNVEFICRRGELTPEMNSVSWLPLYHDMGLVGGLLRAIFQAGGQCILSPVDFLCYPARWIRAISDFKAASSVGPPFGYDLAARKTSEADLEGVDLGMWHIACIGADHVRPEVIDQFSRRFESVGFRRSTFYPCYGLAESTLIVSGARVRSEPRALYLDRVALEEGRARVAEDGVDRIGFMSTGNGDPFNRILIVDPETLVPRPDGEIGEVCVSGASVAAGYFNQPVATEEVFHARVVGHESERYLRTGDLGFFDEGALFITGRIKDLIICEGRKHHPQDIELAVESAHPDVRRGGVAAVEAASGAGIDVMVEVRADGSAVSGADDQARAQEMRGAIERQLRVMRVPVARTVFVRPGYLPRTSSGTLQRWMVRQLIQRLEPDRAQVLATDEGMKPRSDPRGRGGE